MAGLGPLLGLLANALAAGARPAPPNAGGGQPPAPPPQPLRTPAPSPQPSPQPSSQPAHQQASDALNRAIAARAARTQVAAPQADLLTRIMHAISQSGGLGGDVLNATLPPALWEGADPARAAQTQNVGRIDASLSGQNRTKPKAGSDKAFAPKRQAGESHEAYQQAYYHAQRELLEHLVSIEGYDSNAGQLLSRLYTKMGQKPPAVPDRARSDVLDDSLLGDVATAKLAGPLIGGAAKLGGRVLGPVVGRAATAAAGTPAGQAVIRGAEKVAASGAGRAAKAVGGVAKAASSAARRVDNTVGLGAATRKFGDVMDAVGDRAAAKRTAKAAGKAAYKQSLASAKAAKVKAKAPSSAPPAAPPAPSAPKAAAPKAEPKVAPKPQPAAPRAATATATKPKVDTSDERLDRIYGERTAHVSPEFNAKKVVGNEEGDVPVANPRFAGSATVREARGALQARDAAKTTVEKTSDKVGEKATEKAQEVAKRSAEPKRAKAAVGATDRAEQAAAARAKALADRQTKYGNLSLKTIEQRISDIGDQQKELRADKKAAKVSGTDPAIYDAKIDALEKERSDMMVLRKHHPQYTGASAAPAPKAQPKAEPKAATPAKAPAKPKAAAKAAPQTQEPTTTAQAPAQSQSRGSLKLRSLQMDLDAAKKAHATAPTPEEKEEAQNRIARIQARLEKTRANIEGARATRDTHNAAQKAASGKTGAAPKAAQTTAAPRANPYGLNYDKLTKMSPDELKAEHTKYAMAAKKSGLNPTNRNHLRNYVTAIEHVQKTGALPQDDAVAPAAKTKSGGASKKSGASSAKATAAGMPTSKSAGQMRVHILTQTYNKLLNGGDPEGARKVQDEIKHVMDHLRAKGWDQ